MTKKYQKIKTKSQRILKNNDSPKIEKKERGKSGTITRGAHRECHLGCALRVLMTALFLIIFLLFISLDTSGTWNVNRPATKTSTQNTYSALLGSENFILDKN